MGAFLLVLLVLNLQSTRAFASGPGSALPIGAAGAQAVNSAAPRSDSAPAPPAVQATVAPVTGAATQIVTTATEPLTEGGSTNAKKVTAPVPSAVVRSADKTVAPVLNTPTQTVRKAATPVLQTVSKTTGTVAPAIETATQSVGKTVGNAAAPVLHGVTQTVGSARASVLRTATQTAGAITPPISKVASSTASGVMRGVAGAPALLNEVASALDLTSSSSSLPTAITREQPPLLPGTANHLAGIGGTFLSSPPSGAPLRLQVGIGTESPIATPTSSAAGNSLQMAAPSASINRIPPATPGPLPGGSSGVMASTAGVAFSIFLTLAGLLLMGGLATMRLLRFASEPWHAAPFVLIPERPG